MQETTISDFGELHAAIRSLPPHTTFRGVQDVQYQLIPKIGRLASISTPHHEAAILRLFKIQATPYLSYRPKNEWEWIAIAQHHGLPTRLLDWTRNPLVAAFFATEGPPVTDSAVYLWEPANALPENPSFGPLEVTEPFLVLPVHINPRIAAQSGQFTIQSDPRLPFEAESLVKLVIPQAARVEFRHDLFRYGVHRGTLFPDLDGQAAFLEWFCTRWGQY